MHYRIACSDDSCKFVAIINEVVQARNSTRVNSPPCANNSQGQTHPIREFGGARGVLEPDLGRIAGDFDRNTFFNRSGAGTKINLFDNLTCTVNLFSWRDC